MFGGSSSHLIVWQMFYLFMHGDYFYAFPCSHSAEAGVLPYNVCC